MGNAFIGGRRTWTCGSFFLILFLLRIPVSAQVRTLSFFLDTARSSSPLLKDYRNQIRSGTLDSLLLLAQQRPQVLANGQVILAPNLNGFGYDQAITNAGTYTAVASVSQPLFNRRILEPSYQGIEIKNQTAVANERIGILDLDRSITDQYLKTYADYAQWQSNREVYGLYQDQQLIVQRLTQAGVYKQTDLLNLQVALQSQEISLQELMMQYRSDLATLYYLCGIGDTGICLLASPEIALKPQVSVDTSAFYRPYTIDSLSIVNQRALQATRYLASVNWFADAGLEASGLGMVGRSLGASFGVNITVPIYDGHQRRLFNEQQDIAEATRKNYAGFFRHQYSQQLNRLYQQLNATDSLIVQIRDRMKTASMLIRVSRNQLNTGDLRITDYILAINNYLSIKNNLNQARINRWLMLSQLDYWQH